MGDVIEFKKPEPKDVTYTVTVCDSLQNYQVFEAKSVSKPTLEPAYIAEAWYQDDRVEIEGPEIWGPIKIVGPEEIGEAIQTGVPPVRVTFEANPKEKAWYELHEVFLSTRSKEEEHILMFMSCLEHEH